MWETKLALTYLCNYFTSEIPLLKKKKSDAKKISAHYLTFRNLGATETWYITLYKSNRSSE